MIPTICDVGPRDGLQNLARHFSVAERAELVDRLASAGVSHIEAVSFVNPKRVPQMADAEGVLERLALPAGVRLAGLVLNERGVERAVATRLDEIRFVLVASESFGRRNQNASVADSVAAFERIAPTVHAAGKSLTAVVAVSFGCPFEGEVPVRKVSEIVERAVAAGADEVSLADTIGVGVPAQVRALAETCRPRLGGRPLGFHFHNTRNTGYANAAEAIEGGAAVLDASVGGLGGCPFAPGATGNIATEDLRYLMERSGHPTGIDAAALDAVVGWLSERVPEEIAGQLHKAGGFPAAAAAVETPAAAAR